MSSRNRCIVRRGTPYLNLKPWYKDLEKIGKLFAFRILSYDNIFCGLCKKSSLKRSFNWPIILSLSSKSSTRSSKKLEDMREPNFNAINNKSYWQFLNLRLVS